MAHRIAKHDCDCGEGNKLLKLFGSPCLRLSWCIGRNGAGTQNGRRGGNMSRPARSIQDTARGRDDISLWTIKACQWRCGLMGKAGSTKRGQLPSCSVIKPSPGQCRPGQRVPAIPPDVGRGPAPPPPSTWLVGTQCALRCVPLSVIRKPLTASWTRSFPFPCARIPVAQISILR